MNLSDKMLEDFVEFFDERYSSKEIMENNSLFQAHVTNDKLNSICKYIKEHKVFYIVPVDEAMSCDLLNKKSSNEIHFNEEFGDIRHNFYVPEYDGIIMSRKSPKFDHGFDFVPMPVEMLDGMVAVTVECDREHDWGEGGRGWSVHVINWVELTLQKKNNEESENE
jgi:hypothetical protein